MSREERKLERHYQERNISFEERKLRQQAARLRKAGHDGHATDSAPPGSWRNVRPDELGDFEELDLPTTAKRVRRESLDAWTARLRAPAPTGADELAASAGGVVVEGEPDAAASRGWPGVVLGLAAGACRVQCAGREVNAILDPEPSARERRDLAVGDEVELTPYGAGWRVDAVRPRRSALYRPDPVNPRRRQVLAANVDLVVVVVALGGAGVKTGLIDRFLLAIEGSGAAPLLAVNKADLLADPAELAGLLAPYRELDPPPPIELVSAATGSGVEELRRRLQGRSAVLVGQSGVGKSSLANALIPGLAARTAAIRDGDGKGRHTTTGAALHELPGGGRLLDTPGIRKFGLWGLSREDLRGHFTEFARAASSCRFRDCSHAHEPGCGVLEAVAAGEMSSRRHASYLRILESLTAGGG